MWLWKTVVWNMLFLVSVCQAATILRGNEGFSPCSYTKQFTTEGVEENVLFCDEYASQLFGDTLPIIEADGISLGVVEITADVKHCPTNMFLFTSIEYTNNSLRKLVLNRTDFDTIEDGCFNGLNELEILYISNKRQSDMNLIGNLSRELRSLENLKELHLRNINLSPELPENMFGSWANRLKYLHLENNELSHIDDKAFDMDNSELNRLTIERQSSTTWLHNAPRWAQTLKNLRHLNILHTPIEHKQIGSYTLDLGEHINRQLITLKLSNCSLTNIVNTGTFGFSLHPTLKAQLKQLHIDRNQFESTQQTLIGLQSMHKLEWLNLDSNQRALNHLPPWITDPQTGWNSLRYLSARHCGLSYLQSQTLPVTLKVLDLSENPIRHVNASWAKELIYLRELHLNYIRLSSVFVSGHQAKWSIAFRPLANRLEVLSLIGCQIRSENLMDEPVDDFRSRKNKTKNNGLSTEIELKLGLNKFKSLKTLILNNNHLIHIPPNLFSQLTNLTELLLAFNSLTTVDWMSMRLGRLRTPLKRLDLRHNRLESLYQCSIALGFNCYLEELIPRKPIWVSGEEWSKTDIIPGYPNQPPPTKWYGGLMLTGNPLICDCRMAWLRSYVDQMDGYMPPHPGYVIYKREALNFRCTNNDHFQGHSFLSLSVKQLAQSHHTECQNYTTQSGETSIQPCRASNDVVDGRMRFYLNRGDGPINMTRNFLPPIDNGLSTEALIMVIIAVIFMICFIIASTVVITWLCLRFNVKKSQNLYGHGVCRNHRSPSHCAPYETMEYCLSCGGCTRGSTSSRGKTRATIPLSKNIESKVYTPAFHGDTLFSLLPKEECPNDNSLPHKENRIGRRQRNQNLNPMCETVIGRTSNGHKQLNSIPSSLSLGNGTRHLPPRVPLPSVPIQRKTKSTADLIGTQNIDDMDRQMPAISIDIGEYVHILGNRTQEEYQTALPWRSKSMGRSCKTIGNSSIRQETNSTFRSRDHLSVSVGANLRRRERSSFLNWLRQTWNGWRKSRNSHTASITPNPIDYIGPTENEQHIKGPSLPPPPFTLSRTVTNPRNSSEGQGEYLPMLDNGLDTTTDEYFTDVNSPMMRKPKLERKPSKSDGSTIMETTPNGTKPKRFLRHSDDIYSLQTYENKFNKPLDYDLPPPPPPPPPSAPPLPPLANETNGVVKHNQKSTNATTSNSARHNIEAANSVLLEDANDCVRKPPIFPKPATIGAKTTHGT